MRIVIDTNVLVSYVIMPSSLLGKKVQRLLAEHSILRSVETFSELGGVLLRRKFDKYASHEERELFVHDIFLLSENVEITRRIDACRDPRDNKFLELAVCGKADLLVTGDADLLALDPFEDVRILDLSNIP